MRQFINLPKRENHALSNTFNHLLKWDEECNVSDCSWVAVTVFDHWLYESDSVHLAEQASNNEKANWDAKINKLLCSLVKNDNPLKFKYKGRHPKKKLQFSRLTDNGKTEHWVKQQFKIQYTPNIIFPRLGISISFEDSWIVYVVYKSQTQCKELFRLVSESGLYLLPVYSAEHLNNYEELSKYVVELGFRDTLQQKVTS